MDAASDLNTREGFVSLMQSFQVPGPLQEVLLNSGIACIADFAYATRTRPTSIPSSPSSQTPSGKACKYRTQSIRQQPHAFAGLLMCTAQTSVPEVGPAPAPALPQASAPVASNAWAEHAPPRLYLEAVQRMQASFRTNYPGEHLDADGMPSIRLLSFGAPVVHPKGVIKWVPWQLRLSQKQYQDIVEARTTRTLRTESSSSAPHCLMRLPSSASIARI